MDIPNLALEGQEWDPRFERRDLRAVRMTPKITYQQLREQLHTYLSHDTLARILDEHGISKWKSKKRPFLTEAAVKKRLQWGLQHADWSFDWVGGRSDLITMNRDEDSRHKGYSAA
jgi:hypothetical protein